MREKGTETTKTGPNDVSGVVWALSVLFSVFSYITLVIVYSIYILYLLKITRNVEV